MYFIVLARNRIISGIMYSLPVTVGKYKNRTPDTKRPDIMRDNTINQKTKQEPWLQLTHFILVMTPSRVLNSTFFRFCEHIMDRCTATKSPFMSRNCRRIWARTSVSWASYSTGSITQDLNLKYRSRTLIKSSIPHEVTLPLGYRNHIWISAHFWFYPTLTVWFVVLTWTFVHWQLLLSISSFLSIISIIYLKVQCVVFSGI